MTNITKASHPVFILSILLLIVNDWYLKAAFHNGFTGKLSDFAGLFAFAFFFSILFPKRIKTIHIFTGIVFVFWKSILSQPCIDWFNAIGIPIYRTVDVADCIALCILQLSYHLFKKPFTADLRPLLQKTILIVSCFAFIATTMPKRKTRKYVNIDKEYQFDMSKRRLVSALNDVQLTQVKEYNRYNQMIDFDADRNVFFWHHNNDTVAVMLDYRKVKDQDTITFRTSYATIQITGDDNTSALKLLTIYKTAGLKEKDYKAIAIKQFEKRIIRKIKQAVKT